MIDVSRLSPRSAAVRGAAVRPGGALGAAWTPPPVGPLTAGAVRPGGALSAGWALPPVGPLTAGAVLPGGALSAGWALPPVGPLTAGAVLPGGALSAGWALRRPNTAADLADAGSFAAVRTPWADRRRSASPRAVHRPSFVATLTGRASGPGHATTAAFASEAPCG